MSNMLQVVAGVAIIFFVPGYTLVNLLFPRRGELDPEYDFIYRAAIGMGLSVVIAILAGFLLNSISTEEHPYVTSGPLWTVLLTLTAGFLLVGWYRGAYPSAGLIHPVLFRNTSSAGLPRVKGADFSKHRRIERLIVERERMLGDLRMYTDRSSTSNPQRKLYYSKRMDQVRVRIDEINDELKKLGS
jgi:hypothetical protein